MEFPVVCMNETPAPIPMVAWLATRKDYEYHRVGTCNIFMTLEPLTGKGMSRITKRRTKFPVWIAEHYCESKKITLVIDNLNTHRPGALYETYPTDQAKALWDQFEFVYTPKHGNWLSVAEAQISVMARNV